MRSSAVRLRAGAGRAVLRQVLWGGGEASAETAVPLRTRILQWNRSASGGAGPYSRTGDL